MTDKGKYNRVESYRDLALVLAALLMLTAITVTVSRMDLGGLRIVAALTIASMKATLVLIFFMHMRKAGKVVAITFISTLIILAIFVGFIFFDIAYR